MYYLLYGILYFFSLLPFFILYSISDFLFFVLYRIVGYRKEIVAENLQFAYPKKTAVERELIRKNFYKKLIDNFIETIKLLSLSTISFDKRVSINFDDVQKLVDKGLNIQFHCGHQMNWEYASLAVSKKLTIPSLAVYMRISAKPLEKLFLKIRTKFGAIMVERNKYQSMMPQLMKKQYALGLIADQNPDHQQKAYWLNFFNRPAPFQTGPEKGAMRYKTAVVFVNIISLKRGYYHIDCKVITEDGSKFKDGELTRMYRNFLEAGISENPSNYLWSHRRWKFEWNTAYEKRWIDTMPSQK
ncbi:MAG: lysophospholipid acyltransferase family protein [Ferruginibacter sp.]|nr:lysophospholipid acyltransferase family protein [Ferruginibacter sp.]